MVEESNKRGEKEFGRRLAGEVMNVIEGQSPVLAKVAERHRQATINRQNFGKRF